MQRIHQCHCASLIANALLFVFTNNEQPRHLVDFVVQSQRVDEEEESGEEEEEERDEDEEAAGGVVCGTGRSEDQGKQQNHLTKTNQPSLGKHGKLSTCVVECLLFTKKTAILHNCSQFLPRFTISLVWEKMKN